MRIKGTRLFEYNAAALAHKIDKRKLARHLRIVYEAEQCKGNEFGCSSLHRRADLWSAFVWEYTPQGHAFWQRICE